jgi:hypothetical protein
MGAPLQHPQRAGVQEVLHAPRIRPIIDDGDIDRRPREAYGHQHDRGDPQHGPAVCHHTSQRSLGCVEHTLPEEGEASPPIALAFEELESGDLPLHVAVAPGPGEARRDGGRVLPHPQAKRASASRPLPVAAVIQDFGPSSRGSRTMARKPWVS